MPIGPGKYDDICTEIRERLGAEGVILVVYGADGTSGFSAQLPLGMTLVIPDTLELLAKQIRESGSL